MRGPRTNAGCRSMARIIFTIPGRTGSSPRGPPVELGRARLNRYSRSASSSWRIFAIASSTDSDGVIWRPCSSRTYQSTLTAARNGTSSRRRPGTRRVPVVGMPAWAGLTAARLAVRNALSTSFRAMATILGVPGDPWVGLLVLGCGDPGALDVTDTAQIATAVQTAGQHFGGIDVLLNNAGIGYFAAFEESEDAEVRRLMEINVFGVAAVTKAVLPGMRSRRWGIILNVSSIGGQRSFPAVSWYNASKFAVEVCQRPSPRRSGRWASGSCSSHRAASPPTGPVTPRPRPRRRTRSPTTPTAPARTAATSAPTPAGRPATLSAPPSRSSTSPTTTHPRLGLTLRVLVRRLFDANLGLPNLGLGIVDRCFGQLGDSISGCDWVRSWRAACGQRAAALLFRSPTAGCRAWPGRLGARPSGSGRRRPQ